jgi:hypothetical protein
MAGVLAAVVLTILPAPAAAEVNFDPDSPAGKEYALPLPQARNEALGDEGIKDRPPSQATLFGVGIGGSGGGGSQGGGTPESPGRTEGNRGVDGSGANPSGKPQSGNPKPNLADQGSSYSLCTAIALVGGILLIALALGLALRALARVAAGRPLGRA